MTGFIVYVSFLFSFYMRGIRMVRDSSLLLISLVTEVLLQVRVGITEHPLDAHRTVCVAVNYEPEEAVCQLEISGVVKEVWNGAWENGTLRIGGNDGTVFVVEH